ncbi:ribosomal protein S12 methylthiotransferase accessory factor [Streptococcus equinus]|nr:ribosomal protein S12 methylthiotransferase accessory factor [Streptococcus equinus]SFR66902.1 ribosomal protein S12 methylthiotransferase accessory factor [Streptococcus equinus]
MFAEKRVKVRCRKANKMNKLHQNHYKEKKPDETVNFLKNQLKNLGLEVEEKWQDESYVGTFSLRVNFKGTTIGTNGKGCTREYALASAYAELFERFQNGILSNTMTSPQKSEDYSFRFEPNEKTLSSSEIMKQNTPFSKYYCKRHGLDNLTIEKQAEQFRKINKLEFIQFNEDDQYTCVPFYNVRESKVVYIPTTSIRKLYGSNGMSAGNTPEEALVQAFSEIMERVVQKRILNEKISLPDIPEEEIKKYPNIYKMYLKTKELKGYRSYLKDCSLGGKYPVAGLIMVDEDTGEYGIKLGCHPDYGIAMERAFTEATQGNDITDYTNRSVLDFFNNDVDNPDNVMNSFKTGHAQYPYEIFSDTPTFKYTPVKNIEKLNQSELLKSWVQEILDDGYDILVRDVSNLGFPSYHVIIPGLSELRDDSEKEIRAENTRALASFLISNISKVTKDNCKYIIGSLAYYSDRIMENSIASFIPDSNNLDIPFGLERNGSLYLSAMCYALMGEFDKSYLQLRKLTSCLSSVKSADAELRKAIITMHYMASRSIGNSHTLTINYLRKLFSDNLCDEINYIFENDDEILVKQYPEISKIIKSDEALKPFRVVNKLVEILRNSRIKNNINQQDLEKIFEGR